MASWSDLFRVLASGAGAFVVLLVSIRLAGNRTLSSMNASDFIITVAIGTTFASTMLSRDVAFAAGAAAIVTLISIQALTVWVSVKYPRLRHQAEGEAIVLLREGIAQERAMERARVSMGELRQAVRQQGYGGFDDLAVVLLEANGKFSVVPRARRGDAQALPDEADESG